MSPRSFAQLPTSFDDQVRKNRNAADIEGDLPLWLATCVGEQNQANVAD